MTLIEVQAPQEKAQTIVVHEGPGDRDNAAEARRYFKEAEDPNLPEYVAEAKRDTARYLASLALESGQEVKSARSDLDSRVQQYLGNEKPTSR